MTKRINLWSSPRNVSTALMYAFAQRSDTRVVDEPLYAHYLTQTDTEAAHPGTPEILQSQENDGQKVIKDVLFGNYPKDVVIFKQMTHHLIKLELDFLLKMKNVLLLRDPRRIIASYSKVVHSPTIADIGIKMQYELFHFLKKENQLAAVVDARLLLLAPHRILSKLCHFLEIPFDKKMLHWEAGARPEDGCWAKHWYSNVHQSTGFQPYQEKQVDLSPSLQKLAEECQPYYDFLYQFALK